MLGIHISTDWIPVVSGAVGAAGAVLAQVVSAIFTGRRETRAARTRRIEARRSAFADQKRLLFVKTLKTFDEQVLAYEDLIERLNAGEVSVSIPTGVMLDDKWGELRAELDLLAKDVIPRLNEMLKAFQLLDMAVSFAHLEAASTNLQTLRVGRVNLRNHMLVSMDVEDPPKGKSVWSRTRTKLALKKANRANKKLAAKLAKGDPPAVG
ncbi:hypothetical protein ACVW00_003548 [Marmoricola sp. URHA0025 HA25]